jgi:hypothetical protein
MTATLTSYDPALKQIYKPEMMQFLTYRMRPLYGMLPKYEKFGGRNMPIPLCYGNTQGRSHTFSEAQGNTTASKLEDFLITRVENHSIAHISSHVAAATMNKKHAFIAALKKEVDSSMKSIADDIEFELPRSGTCSLGQVSTGSTVTNQTITLEDIRDVHNFEVGMTLRGTSTDGGAYDTGEEVLAKVNRTTGVLTATSAAWNTVMTDLAVGDYLVVSGDGAQGSTNLGITGLIGWIPASAPSGGESFFSVDRSVDSRLYGTCYDGSSQLIEEALIDGQSRIGEMEGKPDRCFLHNSQYRKLGKELGAKKDYVQVQARSDKGMIAHVSYKGYVIQGDYGPIEVVAGNKCQSNIAWLMQMDTWLLASLGPCVRFDDTDGNRILRRATASGVESRIVSWAQLGCKGPAYNGQTLLSAA